MFGRSDNSIFALSSAGREHLSLRLLALAVVFWFLLAGTAAAQYTTRITQVDTKNFPTIRVYVSVTDASGNPIPDTQPVELSLYEEGKLVSHQNLSSGLSVSSVLVLDLSGSMRKPIEKLEKAKEAAIQYIDAAPPDHQIAVIGFRNRKNRTDFKEGVQVLGTFTDSRDTLRTQINRIKRPAANGEVTALQDAIGVALDLLHDRSGRKVVVALTDGIENASIKFLKRKGQDNPGLSQLLKQAKAEECSISTIGVGDDVEKEDLESYEQTGGKYLFAPTAAQLREVFAKMINLLNKEIVLQYDTPSRDRDGATRNISAELKVGGATASQGSAYTRTGLIPHVPGNHTPYFVLLLLLLYAPGGVAVAGYFLSVYRFRARQIERLRPGSPCLGWRDMNVPAGEPSFGVGDLVIKCPHCKAPHKIQSWRLNKCRCMREPEGKGSYCYQKRVPRHLRVALNFLAGRRRSDERGSSCLCYCAGDKEGF